MTFREWRGWLGRLPWSLKWFVLLVLLRPVLDVLYFLKDLSPFLSPLYIVGALTPVLVVASFSSNSFPRVQASGADWAFGIWAWLLVLNAFVLLVVRINVETLELALTITVLPFIYFYVRRLVQEEEHFVGLMTTFLYSIIFPFGMIVYENLVGPISTQMSRGLTRYQGAYADVASYGLLIVVGALVACYLFLHERPGLPGAGPTGGGLTRGAHVRRLAAVLLVGMLGIVSIHHGTSLGAFFAVLALFVLHVRGAAPAFAVVLLCGLGMLLFGDLLKDQYDTIFGRELSVMGQEDKGFESAFHGRGARWLWLLATWEDVSWASKAFGVGLSYAEPLREGTIPLSHMMAKGAHSDYFRILFATGVVGAMSYVFFLGATFVRSLSLPRAGRFLTWGALAVVLLFSVSLTPSLYPTIQYVCFAVFAYASVPRAAAARLPLRPGQPVYGPSVHRPPAPIRSVDGRPGRFRSGPVRPEPATLPA